MNLCRSVVLVFISLQLVAQDANLSISLINSAADEQNPVLSPDGKLLMFTIGNHPQNMDGKKDPGDIWFSMLIGDSWSAPIHAGPTLNDRGYNAVAGFSYDGNQLFLLSHYSDQGQARTQGISVSKKTGAGWSAPENIAIPYYQNKSALQSGFVSKNGGVFVYSAETYGSYGVEDIYVSLKGVNGKWSEPKNLGTTINTQFQELSPSLSSDGKTLYFSSNGRKGFGSFDVFSSNRLDDSWLNWSEPANIGPLVNSDGRELFYRTYNGFALYTSTKNSDGYGDLKYYKSELVDSSAIIVTAQPPFIEKPQNVIIETVTHEPGDHTIKVYGRVTNSNTNVPVEAKLIFEGDSATIPAITQNDGEYLISVPSVNTYRIKIEAPGYISSVEKLDVNTLEMKELEMNFKLQPVEVGATVNLKSVLFVQSKPELMPESYPELDVVVDFLKANANVRIELAGHTDNRGVHAHNVRLSQARVNTVKDYLVNKGISAKRISGKGYGGLHPIADNDNEETRILNRRVEFTIKKF
jgi:OmpA-OmpF porin, OOP family